MRFSKFLLALPVVIVLFSLLPSANAQLRISLESPRDTFLLYEPMVFRIKLQNVTGSPLALQDHPVSGSPWLSFQIFGSGGKKVSSAGNFSVPSEVLRPGESKTVEVNITPLYQLRDTGQYDIKAVVSMASRKSFVTGAIRFIVGKGEVFWTRDSNVEEKKRTYSLIRFLEEQDSSLYLRVEEVDENLVYSTTRLGSVAGFTHPEVKFDAQGKVHLLHVGTSTLYRYSRLSKDGVLEFQEDRKSIAGLTPALIQSNNGSIELTGGYDIRQKAKRKKLSEDQVGF